MHLLNRENTEASRHIVRPLTAFFSLMLAGVAALLTALPAFSAEKTVGVIMPGDIPYYREIHAAMVATLNREGRGDTVELILQKPYPDPISLSNAARKLIALDVDVIVTYGAPATLAAVAEKSRIPVVYAAVYDPLAQKIKARNSTGVSARVTVSSLLRYLRGLTTIANLGVLYNAGEEDSLLQFRELFKLAEHQGFKVEGIDLKRPQEAKALLSSKRVDALFLTSSSVVNMGQSAIMDFARERRISTASLLPDKNAPPIVALFANPKEQGERAAEMVMRIMNGVSPEKIKADSSGGVELVFNIREAKNLGFRLPMELVTEATRLIQ